MRIGFKLTLAFLAMAVLVGLVGYLSMLTNHQVQYRITHLGRSLVVELVEAGELPLTLQAIHDEAAKLIVAAGKPEPRAPESEVKEPSDLAGRMGKIKKKLKRASLTLAQCRQANLLAIQLAEEAGDPHKAEEQRAENAKWLVLLDRELIDHAVFMDRFFELVNDDVLQAEDYLAGELGPHLRDSILPLIQAYERSCDRQVEKEIRAMGMAITRADRRNKFVSLAALFVALLFGLLTARSIARPIAALKTATDAIGRGYLDTRIPVTTSDEFGSLATIFNQMGADLQAKTVSKTYVDNIIASMSEMLIVVDSQGEIKVANQAAIDDLGYAKEELMGKPVSSLLVDPSADRWSFGSKRNCIEGTTEDQLRAKDGRQIPALISCSSLLGTTGADAGTVIAALNISQLRQAEMDRDRVFSVSLDMMAVVATDGNILKANRSFERTTGYKSSELKSQHCLDFVHPDDLEKTRLTLDRLLAGHSISGFENRFRRHDGSYIWVSWTCPAPGPDEDVFYAVGRDVTERNLAEQRLRDSLEEKRVLLKEVHHRVKNNLQVISSLLNLQASKTADWGAAGLLRDSQNRIRTMSLIHEQLYESADLAHIDFSDYLENLSEHLRRTYPHLSRGVRLVVHVASHPGSLDVALPCGIIVNELVSNAVKHAFPDGQNGVVEVAFCTIDGRHELSVSDNGVGLPRGFEPEQSQSLGLKLVDALVKQLDGELEIGNQGVTRFVISFQAARESAPSLASA